MRGQECEQERLSPGQEEEGGSHEDVEERHPRQREQQVQSA